MLQKSGIQRQLAEAQQTLNQMSKLIGVNQGRHRVEEVDDYILEGPPFVITRPARVGIRRVSTRKDNLYDFNHFKHQLPIVPWLCFRVEPGCLGPSLGQHPGHLGRWSRGYEH